MVVVVVPYAGEATPFVAVPMPFVVVPTGSLLLDTPEAVELSTGVVGVEPYVALVVVVDDEFVII